MRTRLQQQTDEVVSESRVDGGRSKCGDRGMNGWMDGWKNMDMMRKHSERLCGVCGAARQRARERERWTTGGRCRAIRS